MYNNKYILILLFMDFGPSKSWGSRSISLWLLFFVVWGKGQLLTVFCQLRFSLLCCVVPFWTKQRRWTQWDEIALSRKILSRGVSTYLENIVNSTLISFTDSSRGFSQNFYEIFVKFLRNFCEILTKFLRIS